MADLKIDTTEVEHFLRNNNYGLKPDMNTIKYPGINPEAS